jgi:hypothetical protein
MKYFFFILILVLLVSCREPDKEKMDFIKKLIDNPDDYEIIIKNSQYYQPGDYYFLREKIIPMMISHIKNYFTNKTFHVRYSETNEISQRNNNKNKLPLYSILIDSDDKENKLYFSFEKKDNKWILIMIARGEPQMDPPVDDGK